MFLDNSACNLASINLMRFFDEETGILDIERFAAACRLMFIAQDIIVDRGSYPTQKIAANSHKYRPIGLGFSNIGSLLMALGLPYDSDEGRGICGAVTAIMHGAANRTSVELARAVGTFDEFEKNREDMLNVMGMHWEEVEKIHSAPRYLREGARRIWDEVLNNGKRYGFRNAQATVLAPTGTISFMMDCDTTGIEPDIALVKYKQLAGGGFMKLVNRTVPLALKRLGYGQEDIDSILAYIDKEDTIEGAANLLPEHLPVFDCAFQPRNGTRFIPWQAHIRMMAAAQPFLSGAISKTVNLPKDATEKDIYDAYIEAWKLGLKAVAIYRDGSKGMQVLSTTREEDKKETAKKDTAREKVVYKPRRHRLPDTRSSITHKFSIAGHEGYVTVGQYPDGNPGEVFITMAKEGSTIGGLMDCFGTAISMSLQYGVPLEVYVNKFSHTRFEPMGATKNPDIRIAKSIVDYIFRWLGITFLNRPADGHENGVPHEGSGFQSAKKTPHLPIDQDVQTDSTDRKAGSASFQEEKGHSEVSEMPKTSVSETVGPSGENTNASKNAETSVSGTAQTKSSGQKIPFGLQVENFYRERERKRAARTPNANLIESSSALSLGTSVLQEEEDDAEFQIENDRIRMFEGFQDDAPTCSNCGSVMVRNGSCYLCHVCGSTSGCS